MIRNILLLLLLLSLSASMPVLATSTPTKVQEPVIPPRPTQSIDAYIKQLVKRHHFNKIALTNLMDKAQYNPQVIQLITHPFEKKPWNFYRRFFLKQPRIDAGVAYWDHHKKTFQDVQNHYGVDPSVIIAIIGIESYYGEYVGSYNELDTLTTLSFYYPKRTKFFKSELTYYLMLTRDEKLNPLLLKGSYAGALGIPQFMPSSYRHYGVDYTKNQSIDLFTNHVDVIASVANYLNQSGWRQDKPIAVPAKLQGIPAKRLISTSGKPKYTLQQFHRYHIQPAQKMPSNLNAALIAMHNTDSTEYWLVFQNFRAIMKYNPNTTYALAVFELSRAIKKAYEQQATITTSTSATPARKAQRSQSTVRTATRKKSKAN